LEAEVLFGRQTLTARYWTESLQVTDADLEYLFSVMLEGEKPLSARDLARRFIHYRVRVEEEIWRKRLAEGKLFQPKEQYAIGDKLVFSALGFALGQVVGKRPGSNPEQGSFMVIQVEFEDGVRREFASELQTPHVLNLDANGEDVQHILEPVDPEAILATHGDDLAAQIEARLRKEKDVVYAAGLWYLKSLLPVINEGHLNLAEAILDMNNGGPLAPEDILPILELPKEVNPALQTLALNHALYHDARFDEVGPAGQVRWYLKRLEPEEVRVTPPRLIYDPIPYNRTLLSREALILEAEIGDEFSQLPPPDEPPDEVTLTLIYPHRRSGTLPLKADLSALFPTAYETSRVRITLIDGQTGDEYEAWVVREARYVVGLDRFYRQHRLPVGSYVRVRRTDDPSRFVIDFDAYRPRTEWIRLVVPQNGRITYQNHKRSIGAAYDDLMVLGTDDLEAVDQIWAATRSHRRSLLDIIRENLPELARLNPQGAVHAKTLYSAVNVVRRCPPGPILAALEAQSEFEHVGGHYWRLQQRAP
jgi:hypothetical protein